jgi:hypothetical protein
MALSEGHICFCMPASTAITHGTRFHQSNLIFMDVLLHTHDIVHRVPAHTIQQERQFGSATITDWDELCRGQAGLCAKQLSDSRRPNKTDESKFVRRKY